MPRSSGLVARCLAVLLVLLVPLVGAAPALAAGTTTRTVSGVVTYADTGLPAGAGEVVVAAYRSGAFSPFATATTDADGRYSLTSTSAELWDLKFDYVSSGLYADEWYTDAPAANVASGVWTGTDVVADAVLARGGSMAGTLLLPDGSPAEDGSVTIERFYDYQNYPWHRIEYRTSVESDGTWEFTGLPAADYRITFWSGSTHPYAYLTSAWQDGYGSPQGERVSVQPGQSITELDTEFFDSTTIDVRFSCSLCGTGLPYAITVTFALEFRADPAQRWETVHEFTTWGETARLGVRAPGEYRVLGSFRQDGQWGYGYTDSVVLAEGDWVTLPTAAMVRPQPDRLFGANRFETSQKVVQASHPDGASVVFVANGTSFADALSAGPAAAALGAPLLLVTPTAVPSSTLDELRRLDPAEIVVVGGTGAVSASVQAVLEAIAPVQRVWGVDRYETSRKLAEVAFESGSEIVYIATGRTFPDALSAGAVAGALGAPLITVNGAASTIDAATRDLLVRLGATDVRIVGGPGAVSPGVAAALDAVPGVTTPTRYQGADRYATSLAVSAVLENPPAVLLAVGTSFADALGGGAFAGSIGSPLIVVPPTCVPSGVIDRLHASRPDDVYLLGGRAVLQTGVETFTPCG